MRPEDQTPLVPRGLASAPKFLENSQDKFLANEDENAYVQLEVFGDPAPTVEWFRGENGISDINKIKFWTDGLRSLVFMGVESCTKADEGVYRCVLTNRFGRREHKFKLFISRSFKKDPPRKREVPLYWSEVPRAKFIKQGAAQQISFTAKLTVSDQTAQWFFKETECTNNEKYEVVQEGGSFTVTIKDPEPEDTGCYRCVLDNHRDVFCETYLDVQPPDPEYIFLKSLPTIQPGYVGLPMKLFCLCAEDAEVSWLKDEEEIHEDDEHIKISSSEGEHWLEIAFPELRDSAKYTCRIVKFGKEGESETSCHIEVTEFEHRFTKRLPQNIHLVERNNLLLQTSTQETFASVKWLRNGQELTDDRKQNARLRLLVLEGLQCLAIDRCEVSDQGVYTAMTNTEETSCQVQISEFPHRFKNGLPPVTSVLEGGKVMFDVEVEDEQAGVKWFQNDKELKSEEGRLSRIQILSQGKRHCLIIKKSIVEDAAKITARTNVDTTSTNFIVKCHNNFSERLSEIAECSEHCKMDFYVRVKDTTAPVYFLLNKFPIDMDDKRFHQVELEDGQHKLSITKVSKSDEGVISCRTPTNREKEMVECKCLFNVTEGESPPVIGKVEPVTCVAILHSFSDRMNLRIQKETCRLDIPYKIEGTRISDLDILIEKEGQEVQMGNDIQMKVQNDRVVIDIVNPQRTNSGIYKVIISNDQGSCEIDIPVQVLDIPSPPLSVSVKDVRKDSMVVQWEKPEDDGGTQIKHYLIEILDSTLNNIWTTIAMTDTGDCTHQLLQTLVEGHRYCVRVTAANKIGQSEPYEARGEVITKDPWDAPSPCGKGSVIDWTPTFMDISWTGPASDGGSPITKFIIEVKESSMRDWVEGNIIPMEEVEYEGNVYRGRCENLREEYEYRFRVIAVNRAGYSKPGSASDPVKAIYKNVSPYIKGDGLRDIKIKEGKMLRFDLMVGGEPVPSIEWFRDDIRITDDDTTSITVYTKSSSAYTLKNTVLSIPKAIEDIHGGLYKLRLKNESGVFESVANVDIDGPPEKKARKLAEQKAKQEEEERLREEKEKMNEDFKNFINRKLSDVKDNGKDEDKDSGLKIGEEFDDLSACESQYANGTEDEDFYEEDVPYETIIENKQNRDKDATCGDNEKPMIISNNLQEQDDTYNTTKASNDEKGEKPNNKNEHNINNSDESSTCYSNKNQGQIEISAGNASEYISSMGSSSENRTAGDVCENQLMVQITVDNTDLVSEEQMSEDDLGNGPNTTYAESYVNLKKAKQHISDDEGIGLDMCDLAEDKSNQSVERIVISSDTLNEDKTQTDGSDETYQISTHQDSLENFELVINVIETPETLFNLEEHLNNLQEKLDAKLKSTGFKRSETISDKTMAEGDKCLLALLDQMNREDQDFKVWERDDYCFLRWYVTKQMETLRAKVENLRFMESIEGDFHTYINNMSEDGIPLDRAFIQAAATIFNKDIILIPNDTETDFEVVVGGLSSPIEKGNPFYLGHIKKSENNSDIFISVMPDELESTRISSNLAGNLINAGTEKIEIKENTSQDVDLAKDKEEADMANKVCRQWKRMDSYNGNATKELDHIIQDILNEDNMEKLNKSLFHCETGSDDENETSFTQNNIAKDNDNSLKDCDKDLYSAFDVSVENINNNMCNRIEIEMDEDTNEEEIEKLEQPIEQEKLSEKQAGQGDSLTETKYETYDKSKTIDTEEEYSCDGWTYDDNTGYWVEDTLVGEQLNLEITEEVKEELKEEFNVSSKNVEAPILCEENPNKSIVNSEIGSGNENVTSFTKDNDAIKKMDNLNYCDTTLSPANDPNKGNMDKIVCDQIDIDKVTNEEEGETFEQSIEQEKLLEKQEFQDNSLTEITHENTDNTKDTEEEYSCDGWIYDDNTGYWVEDTPEVGKEPNPNIEEEVKEVHMEDSTVTSENVEAFISTDELDQSHINENNPPYETQTNSDILSKITPPEEVHENLNTEPVLSDGNKDIEDNDESNDGWTYDPISGYWIEDVGGFSDDKDAPVHIATKEKTELNMASINESDLQECVINDAAQHFEETANVINEIDQLADINGNGDESISKSEETFQEVPVPKQRGSDMADYRDETSKETTDTKAMDNTDLSAISERLQNLANTQLLKMQQPLNEESTDKHPNLIEEKKVVKRKIKIKVSVSAQDQVKQCEDVQDCYPVALALNTPTPHNIQHTQPSISGADITSCVAGKDKKEVSEALESTENSVEEKEHDEHKILISDSQNSYTKLGDNVTSCVNSCESDTNTGVAQTADGQTTEIKMRPPLRKYSSKRTASYRWSGIEMLQVEGHIADSVDNSQIITSELKDENNIDKISYEKANFKLNERLNHHGFMRSPTATEYVTDGDNCLKALIDQMSQPGQDFNVWDKSDFCFLRWYIAKQLQVQISAGKADNYVKFKDSPQTFVSRIQKDGEFTDNDYLYSVAKIFNKDIIVIESSNPSQEVTYIKGGPNNSIGKGKPIFLGHLTKEDAGNNFYQSIIPSENVHIEQFLSSLEDML